MSDVVHLYASPGGTSAVVLPFEFEAYCRAAGDARRALLRHVPDAFTRNEWAYLLGVLEPEVLRAQVHSVFGPRARTENPVQWLVRPRGTVAIWLPGNVSLLGPLTLLAVVPTGNVVLLKGSTRATNLTGTFLDTLHRHAPDFATYFSRVTLGVFSRQDARNVNMAETADVRIVFGSDATSQEVDALPHPPTSAQISFVDRRSEAWIDGRMISDEVLRTLITVFAIYGQAGCTSPSRVRLLNSSLAEARQVRDRLLTMWRDIVRDDVPMYVASECTRHLQWSRAQGWDAVSELRNKAVIAIGSGDLPQRSSGMVLWITPSSVEEAFAELPSNIQTVGHAVLDPTATYWLARIASTGIRRWVPLRAMHHFGWVWDGEEYWRHLFRFIECAE